MRVVVEFDMVDMSMHKHESFFRHIFNKYCFGIRGIKILEPDERVIKREIDKKSAPRGECNE